MLAHMHALQPQLASMNVSVDVGHSSKRGPLGGTLTKFNLPAVDWPTLCRSRYMLHLDGYSYAAALKYRLACGAIVLRVPGGNSIGGQVVEAPIEWFEAATPMRPGVEYVPIWPNMSNLMDEVRELERDPERAQGISNAAVGYTSRALSPASVSSYMAELLHAYALFFSTWQRSCRDLSQHRIPEVDPESSACEAAATSFKRPTATATLAVMCRRVLL